MDYSELLGPCNLVVWGAGTESSHEKTRSRLGYMYTRTLCHSSGAALYFYYYLAHVFLFVFFV